MLSLGTQRGHLHGRQAHRFLSARSLGENAFDIEDPRVSVYAQAPSIDFVDPRAKLDDVLRISHVELCQETDIAARPAARVGVDRGEAIDFRGTRQEGYPVVRNILAIVYRSSVLA